METYPVNPSRERPLVTNIECHFSQDATSCPQTIPDQWLGAFSDANFAWLLEQGAFGIHHVALHRCFLFESHAHFQWLSFFRKRRKVPGGEILKERKPRRKADDHQCDNSKKQSTWSTPQRLPAPEEWKRSYKMGKTWPNQPNYNHLMRHKAFTTLLSNRLYTQLDKFQSPDQAGFG